MLRRLTPVRLPAIAACLAFLLFPDWGIGADDTEVSEASLEAVLEELEDIKKQLQKDVKRFGDLDREFIETEQEIGRLARRQRELQQRNRKLDRSLRELEDELAGLQAQQQEQEEAIAAQIRAAYQLGSQSSLQLLLQQNDPAEISRQLAYLDYANAARADKITAFRNTITAVEKTRSDIRVQGAELAENREQLQRQSNELQTLQARRETQLASLRGKIADRESRIKALTNDSEHLAELLEQVDEALERRPVVVTDSNFANARGSLAWPAKGKLLNSFGSPRPNSNIEWQGVTIAARQGSDVRAIHPGRVVFADWFRGQGLLLIVDHGSGYMSLYGHNQSLLRDIGTWVDAGEVIATVGNSGGQQRAALYFEIRHNGEPRNPKRWCG